MNSFTDIQSFNKLFNEYYERFIHFAVGYVKEKEMAEDFVSEAFTIYWENQKKLLPNTKPQAYILTIVKNKCLNHLEHLKVKQRTVNMLSDHESWRLSVSINTLQACDPDFLFSAEIMQIVDETLRDLSPKTRRIFTLNRFEGHSYNEISKKLKLSSKAIEYHISKALKTLRISLKDFNF